MRDITPPANWSRRPDYAERSRPLSVPARSTTRSVSTRYFDIKAQTITTVEEVETITVAPVIAAPSRSVPELPVEQKVNVMTRALEIARKDLNKERRKKTMFKRVSLILVVAVILLSTGYVSFDTWMTNNRLKAGAEAAPTSATSTPVDATQANEGTDKAPLPASALSSYSVSPSLPRALYISKLNVAARLMPMSVNADGSIQAPTNIFDAGWYTGSVKPGEDGAMFIDGHSSGSTHEGLFGNFDKLVEGDTLQVEKGDGTKLTYKVVHTEVANLTDVDMTRMLTPYPGVTKGLNLMTCTGSWVTEGSTKTLDKRILIFTEQV
jgi:LPXTG-site transpeptidase (sortase) family protein